jgi:hypothetical protein
MPKTSKTEDTGVIGIWSCSKRIWAHRRQLVRGLPFQNKVASWCIFILITTLLDHRNTATAKKLDFKKSH